MDLQVTAVILCQKNWAFDQFFETTFASSPSFAIDKVARSLEPGKDQGCINFDEVEYITEQERINALYKKVFK